MRPPVGSSNVRRQPKELSYLPPTPLNSHRDSDVSLASSLPSSIGIHSLDVYKERSYQHNATATINSFLASHDFNISFKPSSSPSAKQIHQTLIFLVGLLDFNISKIEDLPPLLKFLNYPHKLNISVLKSPAAPHQWPSILALIHWLVQASLLHLSFSSSSQTTSLQTNNIVFQYYLNAYLNFIRGDDEAISELDEEIQTRILHEKSNTENRLAATEQKVSQLEAELEGLRSAPSQKDLLEKGKEMLEDNVIKFHKIIDELGSQIESEERDLVEKEKQLEAKAVESDNICEENKMLKKKVESQPFKIRDVERMKRELQAAETDAGEAELARNDWEEKCWELDRTLANNIRDLEPIIRDCNQALKRLKIGNDIQYVLNPKGTTPAEIMGIDYKVTLKPALNSFADDIKKSTVVKLEEVIALQQKSNENAARIEEKRNQLAALQFHINQLETQMDTIKKETQDYTSRCEAEAKNTTEDIQQADHDIGVMERESAEILKASELKLAETARQCEEEIQMHGLELYKVIDSVTKYKEQLGSKVSKIKRELLETVTEVAAIYREAFPKKYSYILEACRQIEKIE
ncbi:kinetochore protein NDC80 homolog [Vicia villosa]|uniref:kinetochore protein NDC80 homolog n=1 Tax=Vicia villosa TaxID=3911 RepID=UPI00273C0234|nr:kinetochore protein NDC80 homolog [Vicia villosa]